jgi:hypothetical protein
MKDDTKAARRRQQIRTFRCAFGARRPAALSEVLSVAQIEDLLASSVGPYRQRIYSPLVTLELFVHQVLGRDKACQDAVGRRRAERIRWGQAPCSLSSGPYCKARQRLPLALIERSLLQVGQRLEARMPSAWRWAGRVVKIFDATCLSMPDTAQNQARWPQIPGQRPGLGFPQMRVGALIGLASGAVIDYAQCAVQGKAASEHTLLRRLHGSLEHGDLLLADAQHSTWATLHWAASAGVDVLMPCHGSRRFSGDNADQWVWWPKPRSRPAHIDPQHWRDLPEGIRVREVRVRGRQLVTTLPAEQATPAQLDALYKMRWNIEVDFRSLKAGMEMDILRTKTPAMVEKELAAYLLAYNLVRWAMAQAAWLGQVLPRALSFSMARRLAGLLHEQLLHARKRDITSLIGLTLAGMASCQLPHRPGRVEPHAKKRRPRPLPLLMEPRPIARLKIQETRLR